MGFGAFHPRQTHQLSAQGASDRQSRFSASFLHSGDVLRVVVCAVTVQGWTDAQKEFERIPEIVAVVAIEAAGTIVYGELRAEPDVNAVAVR